MTEVRVRFAPSPTGELHVGSLRSALYNFLFARQHGGKFILRIEDTDRERFVDKAEERLLEMLDWAGVGPDESPAVGGPHGPYRQSERLEKYAAAAQKLMADGHAYRCFCTPAELDEMRARQQANGLPPKYDGRCRSLSADEQQQKIDAGLKPVIRMRLPDRDERVVVEDLVRGKVVFNSAQLDDQVLIKSDGFPTYHMAVVVDDDDMGITHVLRAEEWLPSTPKHLYLYKWLGYPVPQFAHLPLLLNPDRSKMSKRKNDVAAEIYRDKGYLPQALINYLALLGWNTSDNQELFSLDELIEKFSLDRVQKAGAVFDRDKLDWMNQKYIGDLKPEALYDALQPFIAKTPYASQPESELRAICRVVQPSLVTLADIEKELPLFFREDAAPLSEEAKAVVEEADSKTVYAALVPELENLEVLDEAAFKTAVKNVQKSTGIKGKPLWGGLRAGITLEAQGPELALIVEILGKETVINRLKMHI